jgi:hypothetical protein
MKSAWVITQEGTRHATEVIGILSARKGADTAKEYVEWLYALLHYGPTEHLGLAKYRKPFNPYEAQFITTNTGVPVCNTIMCGHNPFLVARLAKNLSLIDEDGDQPMLKWTNPDRLVCDRDTRRIIEKVPGGTYQAPIHLPLGSYSTRR